MIATFHWLLRNVLNFASRFRWRLLLAVCFGIVVVAGDYAFRVQSKTIEPVAVSQDGTRILIDDFTHDRRDRSRIVSDRGVTIHSNIRTSMLSPVWSPEGNLTWLQSMPNDTTEIRKLDLSESSQSVTLAESKAELLAAFEGQESHLFYATVTYDRQEQRDFLQIHKDTEVVERFRLGRGEFCVGNVFRGSGGVLKLIVDVYVRGGQSTRKHRELTGGNVNRSRLVFDPETEQITRVDGVETEIKSKSLEHLVLWNGTPADFHRYAVYRRDNPDDLLVEAPVFPRWLAGDMFFRWEHGLPAIEIYEPEKLARTIACEPLGSVLPTSDGSLLVSTMNGKLQRVDVQTEKIRTITDVRWGWQICAAIAAVGLPVCVMTWLWLLGGQNIGLRKLSPMADAMLLLVGVALAFSNWRQSSLEVGEWSTFLTPTTGVLTWTLLATLALFAVNCRSMLGRGLAVLLTVLAGVLLLFKARFNPNSTQTAIYINSGGLFVTIVVLGCLMMRRAYGRLVLPTDVEVKNAERQVSLRQIVILTCCFAALFSVMSFYGIRFTLDVEWKMLVSAVVMALVVLVSLWAALRANGRVFWVGVWLVSTLVLPNAAFWSSVYLRADHLLDLSGSSQLEFLFFNRLSAWIRRSNLVWLFVIVRPALQFAVPALTTALVARYCRVCGMQFTSRLVVNQTSGPT